MNKKKVPQKEGAFRILCIDGGGIRGIYAAEILRGIETDLGICLKKHFDLIAGTSTGAIIAGGLAKGLPMESVVRLFEEIGPEVFRKARCSLFRSKFESNNLQGALEKAFGDTKLGEIHVPLMILSSNMTIGQVHVFKSSYLKRFEPYVRDGETKLAYAIQASCSAPTYFDPVSLSYEEDMVPHLLCDGGLWANDPSIFALTEAVSKFKRGLEELRILSIGTGFGKTVYPLQKTGCNPMRHWPTWGLLTGWGDANLIQHILSLQSQSSSSQAKLILGDNYLKIDTEIPSDYGLDKVEIMGNMRAKGKDAFTKKAREIQSFLST
ncbi:MAG: CBASS cGAMP-activated phospholipase [Gammaproteobacteria bacterium]|nr:CBASS cGAMP-activated phospholipase [Gammaproteobacteria bacterium]